MVEQNNMPPNTHNFFFHKSEFKYTDILNSKCWSHLAVCYGYSATGH